MPGSTGVVCKVCDIGEIVHIQEYIPENFKPISWREHFFGKPSYFESLVDHRGFFGRLFKRIKRPSNTRVINYWHCNTCGIKYEFLPSRVISEPKSTPGRIQIRPGLWMIEGSVSTLSKDEASK